MNRGISSLEDAAISRVLRNPRAVASGGSTTCHSQRGRLRVECVGCYESLCKSTSEYFDWDHSSWLSCRLGFYRGTCDISDDQRFVHPSIWPTWLTKISQVKSIQSEEFSLNMRRTALRSWCPEISSITVSTVARTSGNSYTLRFVPELDQITLQSWTIKLDQLQWLNFLAFHGHLRMLTMVRTSTNWNWQSRI